mmetsp:Transcript_29532/g.68910  ORF Transcript_29532/g.68910 Transcript_29532/m.68910 type:complete len:185 (-) Transcript_29532:227-781(-)
MFRIQCNIGMSISDGTKISLWSSMMLTARAELRTIHRKVGTRERLDFYFAPKYIRWNENLFMELYDAYRKGRIENDPSEGWYKGEIGFLTYYVLPLAAKLDTCGVFGVTSDEFRIYASENLKEWTERGEEMVKKYVAKYEENAEKQETAPPRQTSSMVNFTNTGTIEEEEEGEDGTVEEYENEP